MRGCLCTPFVNLFHNLCSKYRTIMFLFIIIVDVACIFINTGEVKYIFGTEDAFQDFYIFRAYADLMKIRAYDNFD